MDAALRLGLAAILAPTTLAAAGCISVGSASDRPEVRAALEARPSTPAARPAAPTLRDRWGRADLPVKGDFTAVSAPSARVAFAAGKYGVVVKTLDGGETWTQAGGEQTAGDDLVDLAFLDVRAGWALGTKKLYVTKDGGDSWAVHDLFSKYAGYVAIGETPQLALVSYERGAAFTNGHVFATRDGGTTWKEIAAVPSAAGGHRDELQGGSRLVPMRDDYGLLTAYGLFRLYENPVVIPGLEGGPDPNVMQGLPGGPKPPKTTFDAPFQPVEVAFSGPDVGWALGVEGGKAAQMRTKDGGYNWTAVPFTTRIVVPATETSRVPKLDMPTRSNDRPHLLLLGGDRAFLTGRSPASGEGILGETLDGTTWSLDLDIGNFHIQDLAMPDPDHGYAVGGAAGIMYITSK